MLNYAGVIMMFEYGAAGLNAGAYAVTIYA